MRTLIHRMPRPRQLKNDRVVIFITLCALLGLASCSRKPAPPLDGAALFTQKCASCHRPENDMYAPPPEVLHEMSKQSILAALQTGRMKWEGKFLSQAK